MTLGLPATAVDQLDAIDQLHQLEHETRVIWLALSGENATEYVDDIGEAVNGLANRLRALANAMEGKS